METAELFLLLDHENLPPGPDSVRRVVRTWLRSLGDGGEPTVADVHVRYYGGWWTRTSPSPAREASLELYREIPAFIEQEGRYYRVHFQFADSVLAPGRKSFDIRETFVCRPAPGLSIAKLTNPACAQADCELRRCRDWLRRRRACTNRSCPTPFGMAWVRPEQKQVDVHLVVDLLTLAWRWPRPVHVALASDDIDFVPALAAVALGDRRLSSLAHLRFARAGTYLDAVLAEAGVRLITVDAT